MIKSKIFQSNEIENAQELAQNLLEEGDLINALAQNFLAQKFDGEIRRNQRGRGDDFYQYQEIQDGDAANLIDWRASSKNDKLFKKQKEEQNPPQIAIWLDLSTQMFLKSQKQYKNKAQIGAIITQCLEIVFAKMRISFKSLGQMQNGQMQNGRFIDKIMQNGDEKPHFFPSINCLILSDFMQPFDEIIAFLNQAQKHDARLFLLAINDYSELKFNYKANILFQNPLDNGKILIDDCANIANEYDKAIKTHFEEIKKYCRHHNIGFSQITNNDNLEKSALDFWHRFKIYYQENEINA